MVKLGRSFKGWGEEMQDSSVGWMLLADRYAIAGGSVVGERRISNPFSRIFKQVYLQKWLEKIKVARDTYTSEPPFQLLLINRIGCSIKFT